MSDALQLAANVARRIGMVRTWPNLQTIRLAIEGEAEFSGIATEDAAELLLRCAAERTYRPEHTCPTDWIVREMSRLNSIDRFWFEDCRWRDKRAYVAFFAPPKPAEPEPEVHCWKCSDKGKVWNYGPGDRLIPCPDCSSQEMTA
jgi:hypothetical protein